MKSTNRKSRAGNLLMSDLYLYEASLMKVIAFDMSFFFVKPCSNDLKWSVI